MEPVLGREIVERQKVLPVLAKTLYRARIFRAVLLQGQIERLDQVFELLGKPARGKTCEAIQGIIAEGQTSELILTSLLLILALFILLLKQWSESRINRLRASAAEE